MKLLILPIAASLLLMACDSSTKFVPQRVQPPASAMIKFQGPEELPADADMGAIIEADAMTAAKLGECAAAHNALVDYLTENH